MKKFFTCLAILIFAFACIIVYFVVIKKDEKYCTRIIIYQKYVEIPLGSNYVFGPQCYKIEPSDCNQEVSIRPESEWVQLDGNVLTPTKEGTFTISVYVKSSKNDYVVDQFHLSAGSVSSAPSIHFSQSAITVPQGGTVSIQDILHISNPLGVMPSIQYSESNIAILDIPTYSIQGTNIGTTNITVTYDYYGTTVFDTISVTVSDCIPDISTTKASYDSTVGNAILIQCYLHNVSSTNVSIHISDPSMLSLLDATYPDVYFLPLSAGTVYVTFSALNVSHTICITIRPN